MNSSASTPKMIDINALTETPGYDVRSLTNGGDQALLVLDGQVYSLRITRAGKLILTK